MSEPAFSPRLEAVIDSAAPVAQRFIDAGYRFFLVGGVVRDHLLDRVPDEQDLDATTDARPEEIRGLVAELADAVWTHGQRFGTIGCTIAGQTYEITTHRAEAYDHDSRKPSVTFGDRIEDDLARRDFTVNAMAIDLADRSLVDPHGGQDDLFGGVLRTPLDPEISFSEDPLRMLRAARFRAGYELTPVPELTAAITAMVDRMEIVSVERIRDELQKLLLLDRPTPGLQLLEETTLLRVVLPLLADVAVDLLGRRIGAVPPDAAMRWAALLLETEPAAADLRPLMLSGSLSADVVWFASSVRLGQPFLGDGGEPAVRRAAAMAPPGRRIEDQLDFLEGVHAADGVRFAEVTSVRAVVADLRSREPDLDDPMPILDGDRIGVLLEVEPGPDIGVAVRWLRDLRFDEGPVDPAEAARRLQSWWPTRDLG